MSELFDEVCVNLSMTMSLLLLFLSESIVCVHIAIALYTSEDGPEHDKDRNPSVTKLQFVVVAISTFKI